MKIIHCSDIHLGASMTTRLSMEQAAARREELLHTFMRMVDYAQNEQIEAILIAGDLLDTDYADIKTRNVLIDIVASHPDIRFFYLCGNHDEDNLLLSSASLPDNLFTFTHSWRTFDLGGAKLTGVILGEKNADIYASLTLDPADYNIVMLHGGKTGGRDYDNPDTVNLDALKHKNIDYLALGHLHTYQTGALDKRATYCYSGCLEGRGFDECGEKGFVVLDLGPEGHTTTFVPFARRKLYEIEVDISYCASLSDFSSAIARALTEPTSGDFVRLVFVGEYDENSQKYFNIATLEYREKYYYFEYKDKTRPRIDIESFRGDISIRGEFVRVVEASDLSDDEKREIIMLGLRALSGEEVE